MKTKREEHQLTKKALQESEQELRSLFAALTDIVLVLDSEGYYVKIAPTNPSNLFRPSEELLGKKVSDVLKAEDAGIILKQIQQTLHTLQPADLEYQLCIGDRLIWFLARVSPFTDNTVFFVARDITAWKAAELERARIINDMIQHYKSLEQFAHIVSHNLRAPVASILGIAEVMQISTTTAQERLDLMDYLFNAVKDLDTIIKDLNYTLKVKREIRETKEYVHFRALIEEIKSSITSLLEDGDVQLVMDFSEINQFFTIKSYLYSIFYNLILNSIKFRQKGKHTLIRIKGQQLQGKFQLSFKDNGRGIDLTRHGAKVFMLYHRFHPDVEGKGMGLFIVKTQVETLGGKISITSKPCAGTEFIIEFPLEDVQEVL